MSNAVKTRTFRVPDDLWDEAKAAAEQDGLTLTTVVDNLLDEYAKSRPKVAPPAPRVPARCLDLPESTWTSAQRVARAAGESLADVIRRGLESYTARG